MLKRNNIRTDDGVNTGIIQREVDRISDETESKHDDLSDVTESKHRVSDEMDLGREILNFFQSKIRA